jgi:hypothetical protein
LKILRWRREFTFDAGLCFRQNIAILVDQHGPRQIAGGSALGQQFAKRLLILVEQRPSTGNVVGHSQDVAADQLRVFVGVGARDDQRVLHHLARRPREQPIETAIDGHVGHDRHQHRRQHGDDGEQADNLDMQPCRCPAAPPGLNHQPDLAADDPNQ